MPEDTYQLKKGKEIVFTGTENECFYKLLRIQPFSTSYAIKYGGYSIEPKGKEEQQDIASKES